MKLVTAIIQPTKLNAVREALNKIEVQRMTVCDAQGFGPCRESAAGLHSGAQLGGGAFSSGECFDLIREIVIEIAVNDDFLERTIEVISTVGRTGPDGTLGDGKIMVMTADDIVMICDASRGPGAV
ncbi:MAG: P-II family nitrogen regulator [Planctomycetota bacterium]|nr:P-II family nitrogen regulator [Planctomycetota bacterium]